MPTLSVAHIREQGVDMIIVPMDPGFGRQPLGVQEATMGSIQVNAHAAGLAGAVVPVWDAGNGRMAFRAPPTWHRFFASLNLRFVWSNLNRELSW